VSDGKLGDHETFLYSLSSEERFAN